MRFQLIVFFCSLYLLISLKDIQFAFKWEYIVNSSWLRRRSNLSSKSVSITVRIQIVIWATNIGVKLRKQRKLQPHTTGDGSLSNWPIKHQFSSTYKLQFGPYNCGLYAQHRNSYPGQWLIWRRISCPSNILFAEVNSFELIIPF